MDEEKNLGKKEKMNSISAANLLGFDDIKLFVVKKKFKDDLELRTFVDWKKKFLMEEIVTKEEIAEREL